MIIDALSTAASLVCSLFNNVFCCGTGLLGPGVLITKGYVWITSKNSIAMRLNR